MGDDVIPSEASSGSNGRKSGCHLRASRYGG